MACMLVAFCWSTVVPAMFADEPVKKIEASSETTTPKARAKPKIKFQYQSAEIEVPTATADEPKVATFGPDSIVAARTYLDDGANYCACPDGFLYGNGRIGMGGSLEPKHVGGSHNGLYLVSEELGIEARVGPESARRRELDDIRPQLVLVANRLSALDRPVAGPIAEPGRRVAGLLDGNRVSVATGHREGGARHQDTGAQDPTIVDRVAYGEHRLVIRAQVTQSGEARGQVAACKDHGVDRDRFI